MEVFNIEVFGPIAPTIKVKDEEEAVRIAKKIRSGFVAVNGTVRSDPRLPFGGAKKSGIGRELSHYGLKQFVNIKTVVVNKKKF